MNYFFRRFILANSLIILISSWLSAQNLQLTEADSLFSNQKYTEAFDLYDSLLNSQLATPAMLTKMAYIQEGLGNYTDALYYLHLYYRRTSDESALHKMQDLAEEHGLEGYEYSDYKFLSNFIRKYRFLLTWGLLGLSVILLIYSLIKFRKKERSIAPTLIQLALALIIVVLVNELFLKEWAIVNYDNTLIMSGPSAAAEPVDFIDKGNKVTILKSDDLWTQIDWGQGEAWIRNKNIKKL